MVLSPDSKLFKKMPGKRDSYYLLTTDIRSHISEATADKLQVEYLNTDTLFFLFPGVVSKEVPVAFKSKISFRDQYMQTGELKLDPAKVTIYGEQSVVDKADSVYTQLIVMENVSTPVNGVAAFISVTGITISPKELLYSMNVERYVEKEILLPVTMTNLPEGYSSQLNPSEIRMTYRFPLKSRESLSLQSTALYVNYKRVEGVSDTIIAPAVENLPIEILRYTLYPGYVECKVYPNTKGIK
jgi:YbbR domain-containing protein